ncbi:helix-turn-helix domain-containing protein [Lentzea sp. NBC_00516]|uniref:helix-turn-helix domain-containing protein n=1 Tax=Lentzea sp. NBC_00516 TaxID=2903582 RepID=UPI002E811B96|nr:helix-turn-helix transcriptional regulator [Lentzea sp. NBC_00516]WUD22042.1 helix-turn-helix domain-containing protein [Lentzea sp. NBC_00516]
MPKRNSSVVGREFGQGVRDAIEQSGMTQRRLAELLDWQEAKLSDAVNGKGGISEVDLIRLLSYCRVPHAEVDRMVALYRETREKGWLQFYEDGEPVPLRALIDQERLANKITTWSLTYVPGLFQIAGYIRAQLENSAVIKPSDFDELIRLKLDRQVIFDRSREFLFYIHENALRLQVGGPDMMRTQLLHLLMMAVRPYITIRVVPAAIGAHAGGGGPFVKLEYYQYEPAIWVEALRTGLFLDDKESLDAYDDVLKWLDKHALDAEESRRLISSLEAQGGVSLVDLAEEQL